MHEITILSGKGGTGKTSITAALSSLIKPAVICDNDVDAADLFLILTPDIRQKNNFVCGWNIHINEELCNQCGLCQSYCRFNAIEQKEDGTYHISPFSCEGCRLCERVCPQQAIHSTPNDENKWFESETRFGPFIHAQMEPGEENSGRLVTFIRKKAKELATERNASYILSDGPPGIGCPVIASLTGTDIVILVIEPSISGWHDASRLIDLIANFNIPAYSIINKSGINPEMEATIEKELSDKNIPLLGRVPFDKLFFHAMMEQKNIIEYAPSSECASIIHSIWDKLQAHEPELKQLSNSSSDKELKNQNHD